MARRKKSDEGSGDPAWLITFSDLMTLLLTFFVLLLSMAVIDERSKLVVLGSVSSTFGSAKSVFNPLSPSSKNTTREPGPMDMSQNDMAAMRDLLIEDQEHDLNFMENKYVQILSINDRVLFERQSTQLSEEGVRLLDRVLPYLQHIEYPLLVAGHTAMRRDEEGASYLPDMEGMSVDSTWELSFLRARAVYRHLVGRGIPPARLSLEAFGQYHSRYTNNTPEGRQKNRRVDLVLDKRNLTWIRKIEALQEKEPERTQHIYKGFSFDLTMPGDTPLPGGGR